MLCATGTTPIQMLCATGTRSRSNRSNAFVRKRNCFRKTLTNKEHKYLDNHVWRYDGVDGVSAKEQFHKLIEYVFVTNCETVVSPAGGPKGPQIL